MEQEVMRTDSIVQPGVKFSPTEWSPTMGKLAAALAKAQGKIEGAKKDSKNPFFSSTYADLASVWDACHTHLSENELAVVQITESGDFVDIKWSVTDKSKPGVATDYTAHLQAIVIKTILIHSSGEYIVGRLSVTPSKADPQALGSAITYARRYALAAMVGVCPVDDDGNAASARVIDTSVPANKSQEAARLMAKPNPMIKPAAQYGNREN